MISMTVSFIYRIQIAICKTKKDYSEIEDDVKKLYRKNKLSYKAEKNVTIQTPTRFKMKKCKK